MRLINSDGQMVDAKVIAEPGGSANRNTNTIIDNGKYVAAVVICAALAGASAVFAWASYQKSTDAITEYRVMLNHQMYLENQIENLKEKRDAVRSE